MSKLGFRLFLPAVTAFTVCFALSVKAQTEVSSPSPSAPKATEYEAASNSLPPLPALALPMEATQPTPEQLGDALMAHKRYQAAIEAYKKAPKNSAAVWNKMGIAYQMLYDTDDAENCYRKSLRLDKSNANVMNNLGTIYDAEKRYGDAERLYRAALKIDPRSALIWKNLGTALLARHKYKKGWAVYQKALEIDPHIFDTNSAPKVQDPASLQDRGAMNYYMAKGCARAGMTECAISYLRMALNEGYTNPRKLAVDTEFVSLRSVPAFQQLMQQEKKQ